METLLTTPEIKSILVLVLVFGISFTLRKYSKYCPRETKW